MLRKKCGLPGLMAGLSVLVFSACDAPAGPGGAPLPDPGPTSTATPPPGPGPGDNNPAPTPTATPSPSPRPTSTATPTPTPTPTVTPTPTATPSPSPTPSPTATPTGKPLALVYAGPGVLLGDDDTLEMAEVVAVMAGFEVKEVTSYQDAATMARAKVWIQPGGPNLKADSYMNARAMDDQVREFVKNGGGYVGFCGGAFSAVNNLELIKGSAWNLDEYTHKVAIKWLGETRYMHFENGPYIILSTAKDPSVEVVGTYPNGSVAAVRALYGKGRVFITGVHPEAKSNWPPTADPDGSDQFMAVDMIREVAGLSPL